MCSRYDISFKGSIFLKLLMLPSNLLSFLIKIKCKVDTVDTTDKEYVQFMQDKVCIVGMQ